MIGRCLTLRACLVLLTWLAGGVVPAAAAEPQELRLFNRPVAELRAPQGGLEPAERVSRAQRRFQALDAAALAGEVLARPVPQAETPAYLLSVGEQPVFTLQASDLDPEEHLGLSTAAERARHRLVDAVQARRAQADPALWWRGGAVVAGVLLLWGLGGWGLARLYGFCHDRGDAARLRRDGGRSAYLRLIGWRLGAAACWLVAAGGLWVGTMAALAAFPWTQPWSQQVAAFVQQLGGWAVAGMLGAIPGLLTVALVMVLARAVHEGLGLLFRQVQEGRLRLPLLHAETVGATRRLTAVLVWGLALAAAYPYLPGSGTEAFKGLSVLLGVMVTLGSSGVVTQLMSGLVVVYSRSLRKGDFVAVGSTEGVVSEVGALAVKLVTMRNEEVTLPHSLLTSQPIRNYSKLAGTQGTLLSTTVSVGYDAPWRQVHALLTEAAHATPGVRAEPAAFVHQRALNDFYVVYELFAHIDQPLERVAILSALHAAIQDAFNRHGVQIMSPHFLAQPEQPVVVPPARWWTPPARPPEG
ncbi:mechanosensitive ion channel [Ideonella sp. 4Y16]|uniref:mechanosensitive ion channel family protein n=1 Tax=Ideonella alba TaxID=2824118 RepID=UPI001B38A80B|nr:mechanosensitive ion channel domain-containing protein [Ideonella alba]MBQ0944731.1 mechanosensitive ion channel [Ideonella alba]